jgi:Ribbon-helix-helix protein, copG family
MDARLLHLMPKKTLHRSESRRAKTGLISVDIKSEFVAAIERLMARDELSKSDIVRRLIRLGLKAEGELIEK